VFDDLTPEVIPPSAVEVELEHARARSSICSELRERMRATSTKLYGWNERVEPGADEFTGDPVRGAVRAEESRRVVTVFCSNCEERWPAAPYPFGARPCAHVRYAFDETMVPCEATPLYAEVEQRVNLLRLELDDHRLVKERG
jgi:hypothetical protein